MMTYTKEQLEQAVKAKGYAWFDRGDYNLNIIGVRSATRKANSFDDAIYVVYKVNDKWIVDRFIATTDPGTTSLQNPVFPEAIKNGSAILKEGQYVRAYRLGIHLSSNHPALVQVGNVTIYRDSNKDNILDTDVQTTTGLYGINIHSTRPGWTRNEVLNWSAGCQVIQDWNEHLRFISICKKAASLYGPSFTYTLLKEEDLT